MSARSELADILKPLLPKGWRVMAYRDDLDNGGRQPVVQIYQTSIARSPVNPQGSRKHELVVRVIVGTTDPARRDDALESAVSTVLAAIELDGQFAWAEADAALESDLPAYDIPVTVYKNRSA